MKVKMEWERFLDKVYGCWIGKCVSGTIGAPYEGYKGTLQVAYDPKLIENMLPNDDLDLQVLWLEAVEKKGPDVTSRDLADIFYEKCPYAPGEYATFKKNYALGIAPPLSGKFNNNFYIDGMGCPIRSEIWACLAPGDGKLAAELSSLDGCLDHYGESIIAEQYLAALEALAFTHEGTLRELVEAALAYIDPDTRFAGLIRNILSWCRQSEDPHTVFAKVLRDYGHPDCTNMYQNMGITVIALLLGGEDLLDTTMMALNCGFDTDCTCATVGAVIGILQGGKAIMKKHGFAEQRYILSVNTTRRSDRVWDLAEDTALAALRFARQNSCVSIEHAPAVPAAAETQAPLTWSVVYENDCPCLAPDQTGRAVFHIAAEAHPLQGVVTFTAPDGIIISPERVDFSAAPEAEAMIPITVRTSAALPVLMNKNIIKAEIQTEDKAPISAEFGFAGAQLWRVYGPFWENVTYVAPPAACESYYAGLHGETEDERSEVTRQFHLNMKADWDQPYLEAQLLEGQPLPAALAGHPLYQGIVKSICCDRFSFSDLFGFRGPCVAYLVRDLYVPEDMTMCIQIGHSDKFKFWLNGILMAERSGTESWTPENVHRKSIAFKKGLNRIVLKLARTNGCSDFSMMFTVKGSCSDMITCLGSSCRI